MAKKKAKNASSGSKRQRKRNPVQVQLDDSGRVANPIDVPDTDDPGDETQRRYRYQHAYGVILLTGMFQGKLPYEAIWCEHHDDYLTQYNGKYDSFQVKTRKPELGHWELTTDGFQSAITKFALLETRFPGKIGFFHFVTNAAIANSDAEGKAGRSPLRLHTAVDNANSAADLKPPFDESLMELARCANSTAECVFALFKRIRFLNGPSLNDFEAVLSHTHISGVAACSSYPTHQLNAIRDELIQKIFDASSNFVDDPAKHWSCINGVDSSSPRLRAKRVLPVVVDEAIRAKSPPYFRFSPIATRTDKRLTENNLTTLEKKLLRGNLRQQMETMRRRTISTEQHLLALAAAMPEQILAIRNQLEALVQGICDDASLQTQVGGVVSGPAMLTQVQQRLLKLAEEQPHDVYRQTYDCLVGMAGLLTEECTVWWSGRFDLAEATA
jgi:hypothetical protein